MTEPWRKILSTELEGMAALSNCAAVVITRTSITGNATYSAYCSACGWHGRPRQDADRADKEAERHGATR